MLMLNEGTTVRSCSARSVLPWLTKSSLRMTSIGTAEAVTDRGWARGADDDHLLGKPADRHLHVEGDRGAAAHLHHLRGAR